MRCRHLLGFLTLAGMFVLVALVNVQPVEATWVQGHITTDTVWKIQDSPFVVINDVTVDSNATLTIEPGVEVKFGGYFSLIVQGKLVANGTESDRIVFTSNKLQPQSNDWNTILSGGIRLSMIYCTVQFANTGVTINKGPAEIINCQLSYSYMYGLAISAASNVNVSGTRVEESGIYGIYLHNYYNSGDYNVTLVNNSVLNSGVRHTGNSWGGIVLSWAIDVLIHNNMIYSNKGDNDNQCGIYMGQAYNVTISENRIFDNPRGIWIGASDVKVFKNTIYQNTYGIYGGRKAYVYENSICYNVYGFYISQSGVEPHFNDIYSNTYGMNVFFGSTVNATYNYWGDSTGPYHVQMNPTGKGNSVNGNGVDLRFVPFLTSPQGHINQLPVAMLKVDKSVVNVNETATFDGSDSTDDGRIDYYLFDFGDGTNSSWTPLSSVTHKFAHVGTYKATLIVKDDFGVASLDGGMVYVTVTVVVPEFPSFLILPLFMTLTLIVIFAARRKHFIKLH